VVKIFSACNPVNILQVWGLGKLRTYDYYHRFNEWSEKRRTEKKAILSSVLESAEATGSWTVFVSAVPSLHNVNAADVKIRYGFVRVDGEGKRELLLVLFCLRGVNGEKLSSHRSQNSSRRV